MRALKIVTQCPFLFSGFYIPEIYLYYYFTESRKRDRIFFFQSLASDSLAFIIQNISEGGYHEESFYLDPADTFAIFILFHEALVL